VPTPAHKELPDQLERLDADDGLPMSHSKAPPPVRVLVAEGHEIFRQALCRYIDEGDGLEVVGNAARLEEALARLKMAPADVVLTDVHLPDGSGIELCRRVSDLRPATKCLLLAGFAEETVGDAARRGIGGILTKDVTVDELWDAIRSVASGRPRLNRAALQRRRLSSRKESFERLEKLLSPQERHVLELLGRGLTNREIADLLHLSEDTVKHHVSRLLRKLKKRSRTEVVIALLKYRSSGRSGRAY
jgi:two-component system, NarL family, response regulator DevR